MHYYQQDAVVSIIESYIINSWYYEQCNYCCLNYVHMYVYLTCHGVWTTYVCMYVHSCWSLVGGEEVDSFTFIERG